MQARQLAVGAAVLVVLVVGAQLAFTTVGQPVGERWHDPSTVASVTPSQDAELVEVAAAGDGDSGVVGWIARTGDRYRVVVAPVAVQDGTVSIGDRRTVASDAPELRGLEVAVAGDEVAATWERAVANDVVLHRTGDARPRVVSDDPLRAGEPSVALVGDATVLGWQQWNDTGYAVEVAAVTDAGVGYRTVPATTGGRGSPTVTAAGDGFALTWFDGDSRTIRTAFGRLDAGRPALSAPRSLGRARPSGGLGGGSVAFSMGAGADADVVRGIWLDVATVTTAATSRAGQPTDPTGLGRGDRPAIAVGDGRWLAAWVVVGDDGDTDLAFATGGDGRTSGVLSRFPSSANDPSPFYGPNPAAAWTEQGAQQRVLVSGLRSASDRRPLDRLTTEPARFAFVGLAAAVVGLVTLPILPWVFLSMLGAFYLTNRLVRRLAVGLLARLPFIGSGRDGNVAVRDRLDDVPAVAWAAAFVVGEVALLVALLPSVGTTVPLHFAGAVPLSAAAALGTGLLQWVSPQRSPWRIVAAFVYLQSAALWATALPGVL